MSHYQESPSAPFAVHSAADPVAGPLTGFLPKSLKRIFKGKKITEKNQDLRFSFSSRYIRHLYRKEAIKKLLPNLFFLTVERGRKKKPKKEKKILFLNFVPRSN